MSTDQHISQILRAHDDIIIIVVEEEEHATSYSTHGESRFFCVYYIYHIRWVLLTFYYWTSVHLCY